MDVILLHKEVIILHRCNTIKHRFNSITHGSNIVTHRCSTIIHGCNTTQRCNTISITHVHNTFDPGFKPWSSKTNDLRIDMWRFLTGAQHY